VASSRCNQELTDNRIVKQLRGEVERERQVKNANIGLAHNVGGSGATAVVTILRRD